MTKPDPPRPVPMTPAQCVLPEIALGGGLAKLPPYRRFPWDPLARDKPLRPNYEISSTAPSWPGVTT